MAATVRCHAVALAVFCLLFSLIFTEANSNTTLFRTDDSYNSTEIIYNNSSGFSQSSFQVNNNSNDDKVPTTTITAIIGSSNENSGILSSSGSDCSCARELAALKRDLHEEANQRLALKAVLDSHVAELHGLKSSVSGSINNTSKTYNSPNAAAAVAPAVAFSAKLSFNRELKPLDTVVFDTVLTNDGSAYDLDTGKFTALAAGTYLFHSTILSGYNTKVETAIIVNDKEVARIYSGAHDAHGSGSNMAIVNLRSGDTVWVRLLYQGGNHVHGYYSTFSGALLRSSDP